MLKMTAAYAQARDEISMYFQGSGWILSEWDNTAKASRLSHEMPYHQARHYLTINRVRRALDLMGYTPGPYDYPVDVQLAIEGPGSAINRLRLASDELRFEDWIKALS